MTIRSFVPLTADMTQTELRDHIHLDRVRSCAGSRVGERL